MSPVTTRLAALLGALVLATTITAPAAHAETIRVVKDDPDDDTDVSWQGAPAWIKDNAELTKGVYVSDTEAREIKLKMKLADVQKNNETSGQSATLTGYISKKLVLLRATRTDDDTSSMYVAREKVCGGDLDVRWNVTRSYVTFVVPFSCLPDGDRWNSIMPTIRAFKVKSDGSTRAVAVDQSNRKTAISFR